MQHRGLLLVFYWVQFQTAGYTAPKTKVFIPKTDQHLLSLLRAIENSTVFMSLSLTRPSLNTPFGAG